MGVIPVSQWWASEVDGQVVAKAQSVLADSWVFLSFAVWGRLRPRWRLVRPMCGLSVGRCALLVQAGWS